MISLYTRTQSRSTASSPDTSAFSIPSFITSIGLLATNAGWLQNVAVGATKRASSTLEYFLGLPLDCSEFSGLNLSPA